MAAQPVIDPVSGEVSDEVIVGANDPIEETSELVTPASDNTPAEPIANEQNSEPTTESVPDPLVQNRTQVEFGITVPAYQSNALQVRLTWGDTDVTAGRLFANLLLERLLNRSTVIGALCKEL